MNFKNSKSMKNLNLVGVAFFLLTVMLFAACSGSGGKTPKQIEMLMWDNLKSGNYVKAVDIWFENSVTDENADVQEQKELIEVFPEIMKSVIEKKGGIGNVEIISEDISEDGKTVVLTMSIAFKNGVTETENSQYKKVNGRWKIYNAK